MKIGFLCSLLRVDEKYLLDEIRKRNIDFLKIDDREAIFSLWKNNFDIDVVLERCLSHSRALHALKIFNDLGIETVNSYKTAETCGSKFLTTMALLKNKVPTPKVLIAFTPESALKAIEQIGYPVVLKPAVGSWGRLLAKINDREAAETVLEHKKILGSYHHSIFYIQEYIEKPGRDVRTFVVGNETIAGIYRTSEHWITNTSRGGIASKCEITPELNELSLKASNAVGGGVTAVDIIETKNGPVVNEVNYTMEFRNSIEPTGVDIPKKIIDYVVKVAKK